MIRIIAPAKYIEEGAEVMKPTGTYKYTLRKDGLRVFVKDAGRADHEVAMKGLTILQNARTLNAITPDAPLAMEFSHPNRAIAFLENVRYAMEEENSK